ncbi:MAG: hypothetical protein K2Y56_12090 [Methylobacterium sp.]|nr:hypothetical protein [Methylobacterium sp.]
MSPRRAGAATPPPVLADTLGLRGYDAVSYFLDAAAGPLPGQAAFELSWQRRAWRFASRANLLVFRDDPATYAPRLAGHDPLGVVQGRIVDADPLVYARVIFEGTERLYLFRTAETRDLARRTPSVIGEAEARWPRLRDLGDLRLPD